MVYIDNPDVGHTLILIGVGVNRFGVQLPLYKKEKGATVTPENHRRIWMFLGLCGN